MFRKRLQVLMHWLMPVGVLLAGAWLCAPAWGDGATVLVSFPETGAFSAAHREDRGAISIIDFAGVYDSQVNNQVNVEPRAVIAREFLRTHADEYDFLVAFTTFEFDTGDALAFHWGLQNKVQGIGLPQYDNSHLFGSDGRLLGFIDMAALSRYVTDPLNPEFENVLATLGHEVLHQWSGRVRFDQGLGPQDGLIGRDGAHWSNLFDSDASVLYGHDWRPNGDGTFTSAARKKFFSPLDLYLAGLYGAGEVPPMTLIENPAVNPDFTPDESLLAHGPTINGTARTVTIDHIIAAEGPRIPAVGDSQKQFRFAFILLAGRDERVSNAQLAAIDRVRRAFVDRFAIWTGGRATANAFPQALPDGQVGVPDTVEGGAPRPGAANIDEAFAWLRARQTVDGFWRDKETTTLRDTAVVAEVLSRFDPAFARKADAANWLAAQTALNSDYLARQAATLRRLQGGAGSTALRDALLAARNNNGTWGIDREYDGNPLDTALAVSALLELPGIAVENLTSAIDYLTASQNPDGGWSNSAGSPSRTSVTTTVLQTLRKAQRVEPVLVLAVQYLAGKQNPDGGFGDSPSTVHDTANVLNVLTDLNALAGVRTNDAAGYLLTRQGEAGDWSGSTYATALAASALQRFSFSNWSIASFTVAPPNPSDGDRVLLTVRVLNDTNLAAPATTISVYDGDPDNGGVPIATDVAVPALPPGGSSTVSLLWDSLGLAGEHELVAVVDPGGAQIETSENDNRATVEVTVGSAPDGVDLAIAQQDVAVMPANPVILPTTLGFAATVRNVGLDDAENARIQLRAGDASGPVLDERVINIPGRGTIAAQFSYELTLPGVHRFVIVADADNQFDEARENNNAVSVEVGTAGSLDLEVRNSDIAANTSSAIIGEDIIFTVTLRNRGTTPTPASVARYFVTDGNETVEVASNPVQIDAGRTVTQTVVWRVDREGALAFTVQLDPDNLIPELAEDNNVATFAFTGGQATGPNLVVDFKDFSFDPNPGREGRPLRLSARVRNTGTDDAADIDVAFYNGDPEQQGVLIERTQIATLAAGAETTVEVNWPRVPDSADKQLFVVVDPDNAIDEFSEQDNSAFNLLEILSLPDLAVSSGDISLSPAFPALGQTVTISARISNLGQQGVGNALVRIFDGDPQAGGQQIGEDRFLNVPGNEAVSTAVEFVFTGNEDTRAITVQVDPDNSVEESSELNNSAQRDVAVQNGDFAVSERYFSPNGDGVKDSTTLFFRLDDADDVAIHVLNERDETVRIIENDALNGTSGGEVIWDGLDDFGRVARDGRYRLQLQSAGALLGEAAAFVDNNRSPLLESLGTPYAVTRNLTCNLPEIRGFPPDVTVLKNEEGFFAILDDGDGFPYGIYRADMNGQDVRPVVLQSSIPGSSLFNEFMPNSDGTVLAFSMSSFSNVAARGLWLADGDGANLRKMTTSDEAINSSSFLRIIGFVSDDNELIVVRSDDVYAVDIRTGNARELFSSRDFPDLQLSPDGQHLLVRTANEGREQFFVLVNIATGDNRLLLDLQSFEFDVFRFQDLLIQFAWSPDSRLFAVTDPVNFLIHVYDNQGNLLKSFDWPLNPNGRPFEMKAPSWSGITDEFAFAVKYGASRCLDCEEEHEPTFEERQNSGIYIVDIREGTVEQVYRFPNDEDDDLDGPLELLTPWEGIESQSGSMLFTYVWAANERSLLLAAPDADSNGEVARKFWWLPLDEGGAPRLVLEDFADEDDVDGLRFTQSGRQLLFRSDDEVDNENSICIDNHNDQWVYRSLLNLTADLRAIRSSRAGGILLSGTAADLNFANYRLDYAPIDSPAQWRPVQPASGEPVIDDNFATWIPPGPGSYLVRLTARDLAGNERATIKRVSWSETPSITDLSRQPAIFSPNGDGVKDVSTIQYRVLSPVHLEFNFHDASGNVVRTISRDHAAAGQTFGIDWDGRDNSGVVLPDGRYRMMVQNYEFFFEIDSTYPVVNFELKDAYQKLDGNSPAVNVAPHVIWTISDTRYTDSSLERAGMASPGTWQEIFDPDPKEAGTGVPNQRGLTLQQVEDGLFRMVAEDLAGNRTLVAAGPVAEQLIVTRFGPHEEDGGGMFKPVDRVPYAAMGTVPRKGSEMIAGSGPVRFEIAETIRDRLNSLSIEYRLEGEADWQSDGYDQLIGAERLEEARHGFQAVWWPAGVVPNATYVLRLSAADAGGNRIVSNQFLAIFEPNLTFEGLEPDAAAAGIFKLWGNTHGEEYSEIRIFVQSDQDPRYASTRDIGLASVVGEQYFLTTEDLESCREYKGYAVGTKPARNHPERGLIPSTTVTTEIKPFSTSCVALQVATEPVPAEICNTQPPGLVKVKFAPSSRDGAQLTLLTLSPAGDVNDVVFNINDPASVRFDPETPNYNYDFLLDISGYPEGNVPFIARLVNINNEEVTVPVTVLVDKTPPEPVINFPVENGLVCGIQRNVVGDDGPEIYSVLTIDGLIQEVNGMHYTLALGANDGVGEVFHDSRSLDSFKEARGQDGRISPPLPDYHFSGGRVGPLGELYNKDGQFSVRMSVYDEGGFKQCLDRSFTFDGLMQLGPVSVDRKLFSPNGDGTLDEVTVNYTVEENAELTIEVYAVEQHADGTSERTGPVLRRVESQLPVFAGAGQSVWDGLDDSGVVLADGVYELLLTFTDGCGNRAQKSFKVELDNTPPDIVINYPQTGDPLPQLIEVQGSIVDPNMQSWSISFGIGDDPQVFLPLNSKLQNVEAEILARWNTFGLAGPHVLRASAIDKVGNERIVDVPVMIDLPLNVIGYLEAVEPLFSPNGDGLRETTGIRFGLEENAIVDLAVLNAAGSVVRQLVQEQTLQHGPRVVNWDGRNDSAAPLADGDYSVRIIAALAVNPLIRQEEKITVRLDTTPPAITIARPANGVVRGAGNVIGSIFDSNPREFTVSITETPDAPVWSVLTEGVNNRVDSVLASLQDLAEGDYALRIRATDQAEITAEQVVEFEVDNTPPVVNMVAPLTGDYFSGDKGPAIVQCELDEKNPANYRVRYGPRGEDPDAFTTVLSTGDFPLPVSQVEWNVAALTDGEYTVQCELEDLAGFIVVDRADVIVDNTSPVAAIDSPANGDFVTEATAVTGTGTDDNLLEYLLEIAPGPATSAHQFSTVGGGTEAVQSAELARWNALPTDGLYTLRLTVTDKAGNSSQSAVEVTVDTAPPAAPTGLTGQVREDQTLILNWNANVEPDLDGYRVYRNGELLTPDAIDLTEFVDSGLSEGRVIYHVRAVDRAGLLSEASEDLQITVDFTPPEAALSAPVDGGKVSGLTEIRGTAFSRDDFAEYRVYIAPLSAPDSRQLLRRSPVPVQADILAAWDTFSRGEGEEYIVTLEAEDINDNVASVSVNVVIDNLPPAQPTGLTASVTGADVQLQWDINDESDLVGYLLFRNGQLANVEGTVVGDLAPYAVTATNYGDAGLADGEYSYTVVAIDDAGNLSEASDAAVAEVDERAPQAVIVQPENGASFDAALYLLAASEDSDIAGVRFEFRAQDVAEWTTISTDSEIPYDANFDPAALGLNHGDYQFRAVATDRVDRTDPAPAFITLTYGDATGPATISGLVAQVDGGDVTLNWTAVSDADFLEYLIVRTDSDGNIDEITSPVTGLIDINLYDDEFRYRVTAVDINGNNGGPAEVIARVYTPDVIEPESPTQNATVTLQGSGAAFATVSGEIISNSGTQPLPAVSTDITGAFTIFDVPLEPGENEITLRLTDAAGNISRPAMIVVERVAPPSRPTGLEVEVFEDGGNFEIELSWNANPEPDVIGYLVYLDGELVDDDLTEDTEFTDFVNSGEYIYTVTALNEAGLESLHSEPVSVTVGDVTPPEPVELSGELDGNDAILSWTESASPDVEVYEVRRNNATIDYVFAGDERAYIDSDLPDGVYEYTVVVIDNEGNESVPSNIVQFTIGEPQGDTEVTPSLFYPTRPGLPIGVTAATTDIAGFAAPGAMIDLHRNGTTVAQTIAPAEGELTASSGQPGYCFEALVSPDGRYLVCVPGFGDWTRLLLYEFGTDTERLIATFDEGAWIAPRWYADGQRLLFLDFDPGFFNDYIRGYDLRTGEVTRLTDPARSAVSAAVPAPDGERIAVAAYILDDNNDELAGLFVFEPASNVWNRVVELDPGDVDAYSLSWSPDGRYVAYNQYDEGLVLVDVETGVVLLIDEEGISDAPSWSPDGDRFVYLSWEDGRPYIYNLETNSRELLTDPADFDDFWYPQWSPDGRFISFNRGSEISVLNLENGVETPLIDADYAEYGQWTHDGHIAAAVSFGDEPLFHHIAPPGRFAFDAVPLVSGSNAFTASTLGSDGLPQVSDEIVVNLNVADLAVTADDIRVLPSIVSVNGVARINVTIRNAGTLATAPSHMNILVRDPNGADVFSSGNLPVAGVPGNGSVTVAADWEVGAIEGIYTIVATVDVNNAIVEGDERNNAAIGEQLVAGGSNLALSVSTDAEDYSANQPVTVSMQLGNAGGEFDGRVQLSIEDTGGNAVDMLIDEPLESFGFGAALQRSAVWNPGNIFAGPYRAALRVLDATGVVVDVRFDEFNIQPNAQLTATVAGDRQSYAANSIVRVTGNVGYTDGNTVFGGATARLRILNDEGAVLLESAESLADLLPGSSTSVSADWNTGIQPAGEYRVELAVMRNSDVIVQAESFFDIESAQLQLSGRLDIENAQPDIGAAQSVGFTVSNLGNAAIFELPVEVSLRDPASQAVLQSETVLLDIPVGGVAEGAVNFATGALALRSYRVLLQAAVNGQSGTLDSAEITPQDRMPPTVAIVLPVAGAYATAGSELRFTARDNHSAIGSTEYRIDEGPWLPAVIRDVGNGQYGNPLPGLSEGVHTLRARATDTAANTGYSQPLTFNVDTVAPAITIDGVGEGEIRNDLFVPVINVVEANPGEKLATLNGQPFVSGSQITGENDYTLIVQASDLAGNTSSLSVHFAIDKTAPGILIAGVIDGDVVNTAVTPEIVVADSHLAEQSITLNGQPYVQGTPIGEEGQYLLQVSATDLAGNTATDSVGFTVDLTAPAISIAGVADGAVAGEAVTPVISVDDANPESVSIQLNGQPFVSGTAIAMEGSYTLSVFAADKAGNLSERTLTFAIDLTAPAIVIDGVFDGMLTNMAVTPEFEITDPNLSGQSITLNGAMFIPGSTVADEGLYELIVVASDLAGNSAEHRVGFEIDLTPPALTVTSPQNGGTVNTPAVDITGVTEPGAVVLLVDADQNQKSVLADENGVFTFTAVSLAQGGNEFTLTARDKAGNSSAALIYTLTRILEQQIELTGRLEGGSRVLVWLPESYSNMPPLALERLLLNIFDASGMDYKLTYNEDDFWTALYSQRYNVALIADLDVAEVEHDCGSHGHSGDKHKHAGKHDDASRGRDHHSGHKDKDECHGKNNDDDRHGHSHHKHGHDHGKGHGHAHAKYKRPHLSQALREDLRLTVASGVGLVMISTHPNNANIMSDVMGAKAGGVVDSDRIELIDSPLGIAAIEAIAGRGVKLDAVTGLTVGWHQLAHGHEHHHGQEHGHDRNHKDKKLRHPKVHPALVINTYVAGNTVLAGFDPADMHDQSAAERLLSNMIEYASPVEPLMLPGFVTDVHWTASDIDRPLSAVMMQVNDPAIGLLHVNDGSIVNETTARWDRLIEAPQALFTSTIRLPAEKGEYFIDGDLSESLGGMLVLLRAAGLPVHVGQDRVDLANTVLDAMRAIDVKRKQDVKKLQKAIWKLENALSVELTSQYSVQSAMWSLSAAYEELERIDADTGDAREQLGKLWRVYQLKWHRFCQSCQ